MNLLCICSSACRHFNYADARSSAACYTLDRHAPLLSLLTPSAHTTRSYCFESQPAPIPWSRRALWMVRMFRVLRMLGTQFLGPILGVGGCGAQRQDGGRN